MRTRLLVIERARRLTAQASGPSLLEDLGAGLSVRECALRHGLTPATVMGVRSFYDLIDGSSVARKCVGTACWFAAGDARGSAHEEQVLRCLGRCYAAPARSDLEAPAIPRQCLVATPVVLRHLLGAASSWSTEYELPDGATILGAIERSGLRGRGGAAYPTAAKWRVARETSAPERCVVCNGDEGDPGAYIDRLLLEEAPHSVLAGMLACARAIDARVGIVFVRGEYPTARARVQKAVDEAERNGWLGDLAVRVVAGAGSYVAGEETALLRAIEGLRAEPSPKPPYPAQVGLFGLPTVVQNAETLSIVPWVVRHERQSDTKAVCLSGAVQRPGVVEVRLGTPLRQVLIEGGGGPPAGVRWKMALVGGPMGRVLPERAFDTPLSFDALPGMGHAGVVVMDESVRPRELAAHLFDFAASESCGSCTPCRVGTTKLGTVRERAIFEALLDTLEAGSLCGFGQGVPRPLRDLLAHFGNELFAQGSTR